MAGSGWRTGATRCPQSEQAATVTRWIGTSSEEKRREEDDTGGGVRLCLRARAPSAREQPPADCKPSSLNIPGAPYPCVYPDNRVMFRVVAPDAQKVRVRLGQGVDMTKAPDGMWCACLAAGGGLSLLHALDRWRVVADPATRTFFGSGYYNSAIEVPEPDAYYTLKDVPREKCDSGASTLSRSPAHGAVPTSTRRPTTTPPRMKYPVLPAARLGRERAGLARQGHVDVIMDNLIAEKKAKPMIVVMDNLNAVKPGERGAVSCARRA